MAGRAARAVQPADHLTEPIWTPGAERARRSNMTAFLQRVRDRRPAGAEAVVDFPSLYRWSVERPDVFWPEVWDFCGVVAEEHPGGKRWDQAVVGLDRMAPPDPSLGPRWFTGARLNFAENLLRFADDREALVFWNELGRQRSLSYREFGAAVTILADALHARGIGPGDRVAGFLPNLPETVIAMLATASLGAIWSSCSPDFGANGVLDRFGQIEPRVLFCADGYRYAGKMVDSLARVREVRERIPSIEHVVVVPYLTSRRTSAFPSTTPSASCTPPAPPACRSAWCTAPGERCCSTSRSWCCTPISRAMIGSSTSAPAAG